MSYDFSFEEQFFNTKSQLKHDKEQGEKCSKIYMSHQRRCKANDEIWYNKVIGVDEVGRGPLAGPVVSAAILCDKSIVNFNVKDSKKLSKAKREVIYSKLIDNFEYSINIQSSDTIDEINILEATKQSMKLAILDINPECKIKTIVDGNFTPIASDNIICQVKADSFIASVAAASIIAKVTRDRLMEDLDKIFPQYKWYKNSGYGTKEHIEAIRNFGLTIHHRKSFCKNFMPSFYKMP